MRINFKKFILILTGTMICLSAHAALVDESTMDQAADQSNGNYQAMNMNYAGFNSLGMTQKAWLDPLQNLGEGQSKPAYSKYYWTPDLVLPIRLREAMLTMINFPEWELIEKIFIGDPAAFRGDIVGTNTVMLYPNPGAPVGVDTNVMIFGRSGNKYVFYVRSEGTNTERLTNSVIDIDVVDNAGTSGGSPSSSSGVLNGRSGGHINASGFMSNSQKMTDATFTRRFLKEDWLKSIPMDPTKFKFDVEIYVPNPDDVVIAPERVWHDDIFTYIDLGEKALNMVQRPIVTLIVERVETPVGFRTKGPNNRLIIVEGIGDMVLRNGKRMVCLKMRRSDEEGLQYVTYAENDNDWDVGPKIPGGKEGNSGSAGNAASAGGVADSSAGNGGNVGANASGNSLENGNAGFGGGVAGSIGENGNVGLGGGVASSVGENGVISAGNYAGAANINCDKMYQIDRANGSGIINQYPQYKYGAGFQGDENESLSIELGTDASVNNLEALWQDLSGRYSNLLSGYEPFYSVDTPADGQGKELFHLRVGPIKNLDSGDSICSQLGRNGVFCSVVRVQ